MMVLETFFWVDKDKVFNGRFEVGFAGASWSPELEQKGFLERDGMMIDCGDFDEIFEVRNGILGAVEKLESA